MFKKEVEFTSLQTVTPVTAYISIWKHFVRLMPSPGSRDRKWINRNLNFKKHTSAFNRERNPCANKMKFFVQIRFFINTNIPTNKPWKIAVLLNNFPYWLRFLSPFLYLYCNKPTNVTLSCVCGEHLSKSFSFYPARTLYIRNSQNL